jgi:hypothetical protein
MVTSHLPRVSARAGVHRQAPAFRPEKLTNDSYYASIDTRRHATSTADDQCDTNVNANTDINTKPDYDIHFYAYAGFYVYSSLKIDTDSYPDSNPYSATDDSRWNDSGVLPYVQRDECNRDSNFIRERTERP